MPTPALPRQVEMAPRYSALALPLLPTEKGPQMNQELLKALFEWCLENHLPELKAFTTKDGEIAVYHWALKQNDGYLEVLLDPSEWVLNVEFSWDEWDYECNAMGRDSHGYSVQIETVDQLKSALWGAFQ